MWINGLIIMIISMFIILLLVLTLKPEDITWKMVGIVACSIILFASSLFFGYSIKHDTKMKTYKEALLNNPYKLEVIYSYKNDELIKQDTVYTLKDK